MITPLKNFFVLYYFLLLPDKPIAVEKMDKFECTEEVKELLFQIPLFKDLPDNIKPTLLTKLDCQFWHINKKEVVARQNTPCKWFYVLLKGRLRADIIDALGNDILIEYIEAPRAFATPHLFSADSTLPATFTVLEEGILLMASKESLFRLFSEEPGILRNFLRINGNCTHCTVKRLRMLSYKNVRSRIIAYLMEHKKKDSEVVTMVHNQLQLAEYLGVTRPALSKEINKMAKEGLIRLEPPKVYLLAPEVLKRCLI